VIRPSLGHYRTYKLWQVHAQGWRLVTITADFWHRVKGGRFADILGKQEARRVNKWRRSHKQEVPQTNGLAGCFCWIKLYFFLAALKENVFRSQFCGAAVQLKQDYTTNVNTVSTSQLYKIRVSPIAFFFQIFQQLFVVIWKLIVFPKKVTALCIVLLWIRGIQPAARQLVLCDHISKLCTRVSYKNYTEIYGVRYTTCCPRTCPQ
jgi:hypothetical protein